jgi:hypothetical protein
MDRVSDERLNDLISSYEFSRNYCNRRQYGLKTAYELLNLLLELKARREAERRPDPLSQALNEGDGTYRP